MRNNRTYIYISFYIFIIISSIFGIKVELRDNTVIDNLDTMTYYNGVFKTPINQYTRDDIKTIFFQSGQQQRLISESGDNNNIDTLLKTAQHLLKHYTDESGVIILDKGNWKLNDDGTRTYRYHFQGLIIKDDAKSFGNISLNVNEIHEQLKIIRARTIHLDGRIINIEQEDIKTVSPKGKLAFFGRNKHTIFTLQELKSPCIVEYIYEYNVFNPFDTNVFSGGWHFQMGHPAITSVMTVSLPDSQKLNYKLYNSSKYDTLFIRKQNTYTWQFSNVPAIVKEPYMPPQSDIVPRVIFTNQPDWDYIFSWYRKMQQRRMKITDNIRKTVEKIIQHAGSIHEKIAAIYYWLQEKILYVSIKGSVGSGLSGHPADETLQNKYGDCIDKAILFATMLKVIDIKAYPIIVKTTDISLQPYNLPSFGGNHAINMIELDNKSFFLDSTSSTHRYPSFRIDDQGAPYINALKEETGIVPLQTPAQNQKKYCYHINMNHSDISVAFATYYNGSYEAGVRAFWRSQREIDVPTIIRQWVKNIHPDARIDTYSLHNLGELSKPLSIQLTYRIEDYLQQAGNIYIFKLLGVSKKFQEITLDADNRNYDIVYPAIEQKVNELDIKIPVNMQPTYIPENITLENNYVKYSRDIKRNDNLIVYSDTYSVKQKIVPVTEYQQHKELLQKIEKLTNETIVFEEINE